MVSKKEYAISPLQMNHSLGGLLYLYYVLNMSNCELHTYISNHDLDLHQSLWVVYRQFHKVVPRGGVSSTGYCEI
jgi:hypothetical protein